MAKAIVKLTLFLNTRMKKQYFPQKLMLQGVEHQKLIISNPDVMMGKAVIAGTRVTVELILEKLAAGETIEEILAAHPRLTRDGVQAALKFAAEALRADVVYPIAQ